MTAPSSTAAVNSYLKAGFVRFLLPLIVIASISSFFWFFGSYHSDPFIQETLKSKGSVDKGNKIFRMNCVGCHGISAQGLVGPDLNEATSRLSDGKIINQVTKGLTPPMPSFEIDSESMADLLAYMHSLN
ncbi:cytochrome c [Prochlorococcus sp. MIT 1223]|uniref:cytochrome c n=1 Tax=Prochlorococcus sp. MIT 1223 TaxID=3096217 RepID=UPI002A757B1C|nr:cytochrome c [Prochlorococcus sp. MIT 1223]